MLSSILLCSLLTLTSALSNTPQHIFSNPPVEDEDYRIPTVHESAVMARRILHLSTIGNLVTTFPTPSDSEQDADNDTAATLDSRPSAVQGSPIGLMEYYADCEPTTGNPTFLAIDIATPFRNYDAGSNISLSVRWWPKSSNFYYASTPDIPTPHTPAALPRFSLHGRLEPISNSDLLRHYIPACFLKSHPDSVLWQPGNDVSHESQYVRLVVEYVYWFGGFGDRARIGWLPLEAWQNVTMEEIDECRLPGEKEKEKEGARRWWKNWL